MIKGIILIGASIVTALALTILPLPEWAIWLRPLWVPMVITAWVLVLPERVSIGIAFAIGLIMDILLGTLLGEHALVLTILAYVSAKFQHRLRLFPLWQQTTVVFFLLFIYQLVRYWVQGFLGQLPGTWAYWLPLLSSTLLWPWVYLLLRDYATRSKLI